MGEDYETKQTFDSVHHRVTPEDVVRLAQEERDEALLKLAEAEKERERIEEARAAYEKERDWLDGKFTEARALLTKYERAIREHEREAEANAGVGGVERWDRKLYSHLPGRLPQDTEKPK